MRNHEPAPRRRAHDPRHPGFAATRRCSPKRLGAWRGRAASLEMSARPLWPWTRPRRHRSNLSPTRRVRPRVRPGDRRGGHDGIHRRRRGLRGDGDRRSAPRRRRGCRRRATADVAGRLDGAARARLRQEAQRVEVALLVGGFADSEVDIGHVQLRDAARTDGADLIAFPYSLATPDAERTEVHEGHRVAVRSPERHGLAAAGNASGERDGPGGGRGDRGACRGADVDPAVLAAGVRVTRVERERRQYRSRHGPGPAERRSRDDQRGSSGNGE